MPLKCSNNAQCFCLTKINARKNASIMYKSLCAEEVDFPVAHNNSLGKLSSRMRHNNEKDEHLTSLCANSL